MTGHSEQAMAGSLIAASHQVTSQEGRREMQRIAGQLLAEGGAKIRTK